MAKKAKSTFDEFINSLTPKEKKEFEKKYKDLLLSELLIAASESNKKEKPSVKILKNKLV